jgi:Transposase DDE domain
LRVLSKKSTAKCNKDIYSAYLMSEPINSSCLRLSEIMPSISHDSVNRFLNREKYTGQDLYNENAIEVNLCGGSLSVDDSVLDKMYSNPEHAPLIDYFWSGKHHKVVKGINLITLFYIDISGKCLPVNFRIYDKRQNKTKNEHFREMLTEVLSWGLKPSIVTGDAWYSSLENLKHIRKNGLDFLFGIEKDRQISLEKGSYIRVDKMKDFADNGRVVYLKEFGSVKVFRQLFKEEYRYYIMGVAKLENLDQISQDDFTKNHANHWQIETFHRAIKQVCNIEKFQVRKSWAIRNHIYCAIRAFSKLEIMKTKQVITNWYQLKRTLFNKVIADFINTVGIQGLLDAQLV